ncbi:MAG: PilZ domain-containing protein [Myxococcaceae bacterium]|nr:PilZ domain-containing protein [Myxococcaceae bacterium]
MSFELAWPQRSHRVRFKKAVRVVPLIDGPPRAYRVLSGNLSKQGMFLSTPEPFAEGTRVALSIEAGGRVLPFAQGEVMWRQATGGEVTLAGKPCGGAGFGVRFTGFLHPKAHELVDYLVANLDTGRPLSLPRQKRWKRVALWAGGVAASLCLATCGVMLARQVTFDPAQSAQPAPEETAAVAPAPELPHPPLDPVVAAGPAPAAAEVPTPAPALEEAPPKAEPVMAAAAPAAVKSSEPALSSAGLLPLPKCGASSLRWSQRGSHTELEVAPASGGKVAAAFRMKNPERLVIDLTGPAPKRSHVVKAAEIPNVSALRIGKRKGGGTRLVLDLVKPSTLKVEGSRLELSY